MEKAREMPQTNIRMPVDLKKWVQQQAEKNCRSFNNEIIFTLQQCRSKEGTVCETANNEVL